MVNDAVFCIRTHLGRDHGFGIEQYADAADNHVHLHDGAVYGSGERLSCAWHGAMDSMELDDDRDDCNRGTDQPFPLCSHDTADSPKDFREQWRFVATKAGNETARAVIGRNDGPLYHFAMRSAMQEKMPIWANPKLGRVA